VNGQGGELGKRSQGAIGPAGIRITETAPRGQSSRG
jgi:hypothetical protein